jgi:tripartite-type tricarboxylate transporter receptor subunit TctC
MSRRPFLAAALALLAGLVAGPGLAQDWPQAGKTIQLIVPAPGGSGTGDTIARVLAEELQSRLKATFVVDNKAGANGNIGASAAATMPGDGYHFLFSWAGTLAVNKALYKNLSFDAQKDFVPILLVADVPNILVVNNDIPAKDLAEFERYAKANPGKLNFGSTGIGSSMHLAGELFMRETGAQMIHVPYNAPGTGHDQPHRRRDPAHVPAHPRHRRPGEERQGARDRGDGAAALAGAARRADDGRAGPAAPALVDLVRAARAEGTPPAVIARMNAVSNEILADPAVKKRLAEMGASTLGGTPQQLAEHLAAETEKWGRVVRDARISAQ